MADIEKSAYLIAKESKEFYEQLFNNDGEKLFNGRNPIGKQKDQVPNEPNPYCLACLLKYDIEGPQLIFPALDAPEPKKVYVPRAVIERNEILDREIKTDVRGNL
jgi:hypothetical protein